MPYINVTRKPIETPIEKIEIGDVATFSRRTSGGGGRGIDFDFKNMTGWCETHTVREICKYLLELCDEIDGRQ